MNYRRQQQQQQQQQQLLLFCLATYVTNAQGSKQAKGLSKIVIQQVN